MKSHNMSTNYPYNFNNTVLTSVILEYRNSSRISKTTASLSSCTSIPSDATNKYWDMVCGATS